jgi:hypothetical protein
MAPFWRDHPYLKRLEIPHESALINGCLTQLYPKDIVELASSLVNSDRSNGVGPSATRLKRRRMTSTNTRLRIQVLP